ncbi:MAG TPA: hypothetical protein VNA66_13725 [Gammaproteobacteria bacterium]|jgi:Ca2+-binding EF-hand superfamily protein|nr:hypothetical protein [Gammaproteobacteria bacterium]
MIMKKLAFATLVAMGMTAAAIAQQPGSQPGSSSTQPQTQPRNSQPPSQSQTPRQQQPSSQTSPSPAPRGGDRTEQVSFDKADKNSDGKVSREEANDIDGFDFSRADTNSDASLSRQEYQAAMATSTPRDSGSARSGDAAPGAGQQRQAQVTFDTADKDKDGKITRDEASTVPGLNFTSADTNADASLSRQEYQVAMAGAQPRG